MHSVLLIIISLLKCKMHRAILFGIIFHEFSLRDNYRFSIYYNQIALSLSETDDPGPDLTHLEDGVRERHG